MNKQKNVEQDAIKIGIVSVSDRAALGIYEDKGLPSLKEWLNKAVCNPVTYVEKIIQDELNLIIETLKSLVDDERCHLIFTTGGTGPAVRDVTPEATLAIAHKDMPGFGEQMRQISLNFVPTAILSRQVAVIRGQTLIVNLPGQPKSIAETLGGVTTTDKQKAIAGIFAAIPYCVDLIGGPYIVTNDDFCAAFRPKSARRE